jgi:hypothetical protein
MPHDSSTGTFTPFAARLHAGTWKAVPVKTPKGAMMTVLTDVSCKAATFCLAVGETISKTGSREYALVWDGSTLTPIAAPAMPAHTFGMVTSVSCVAVKSCVAAGFGIGAASTSAIIWTWNGTRWARTVVPDADPNVSTQFSRLHCFSLTSCVVTGDLVDNTNDATDTPVAVSWNGTTFTNLHAPVPSGISSPGFSDLSCVSAHSCAFVGGGALSTSTSAYPNTLAFAEVWNGKAWTVTKWSGPKGDTYADLNDVYCTSPVRCIAAGDHGTDKSGTPSALGWNGTRWTVLKVAGPGTGKTAAFEAISCPVNGRCVTTGMLGKANGSTGVPLAGYWNGRAWKYGPMLAAAAA